MSLKLDDLLVKKKEPVQILDLSKSTANSKEELKKLLEKIPEFKIKMDKVKPDDVKIYDKKFTFKTPKKELKEDPFPFVNPTPTEMKSLRLDDLCSIAIQWKMLTSLRPKVKTDEEYYSKLVELGKLQLNSREKERKTPLTSYMRKSKNKAGLIETRIVFCRNCGEEFCSSETCRQFAYDLYERENVYSGAIDLVDGTSVNEQGKQKSKKKKTFKSKRRRKKKTKPKKEPSNVKFQNRPKQNLQSGQAILGSKIQKVIPQKETKNKIKSDPKKIDNKGFTKIRTDQLQRTGSKLKKIESRPIQKKVKVILKNGKLKKKK